MIVNAAITPLRDSEPIQYGLFYGLLSNQQGCDRCDGDGYSAVVAINGHGMILSLVHPSRVTLLQPTEK